MGGATPAPGLSATPLGRLWLAVANPPSSPSSCRFGRKPILSCSYLLLAASGSGAAFSPAFPIYMALRFVCGFSMAGVTLSTVILSEPQGKGAGEHQPKAERRGSGPGSTTGPCGLGKARCCPSKALRSPL